MDEPNAERQTKDNVTMPKTEMLYKIDERPPWYLCILLAFQQFLTCFGSIAAYPLIISGAICITGDGVGLSELISTVIFVTGLSSLLQTTFGVRLPIIQGASYAFITPVFVTLESDCPKFDNATQIEKGSDEHRAIWQSNLCQIQGALLLASLFQIVIGLSGLIGFLMRFIGPLTIAPTISLIGLSLFGTAYEYAQSQWWICIMTIVLVTLFSQYLRNVEIPCPCLKMNFRLFELFPVLLGIIISWLVCLILTVTDALPDDPDKWGYFARTDVNWDSLEEAPWFRFPYPGQWGTPSVTLSGVMGMLAAVIASMIESVGDYYACARLTGAPQPPGSAVNRGIGMEGFTCLLGGAWGTGGGNTSYSSNIATIGITKVASRIVIQISGVIMIALGCFGKFGALFVTIPEPIIGGLFYIVFGIVISVGISSLQFVDLNSTRNLFVFGVSTFFGLSMPTWLSNNRDAIDTGDDTLNQVLRVLCGTNILIGGVVAFILDNTIPGTREERGLLSAIGNEITVTEDNMSVYDLPLIQPYLNRLRISRYLPFLPNFRGDKRPRGISDNSYDLPQHTNTKDTDPYFDGEAGYRRGNTNPCYTSNDGSVRF